MDELKAPVRACRLTLDLQADNRDELLWALSTITKQLERGELTRGASGGPHSGWTYDFAESDHPTHDEYFAEVHRYLDAKKAAAAAGVKAPLDRCDFAQWYSQNMREWVPIEAAEAAWNERGRRAAAGVNPSGKEQP